MASLKNVRHEKFAQCVASGLSGAEAYRQAAEYSGKQADGNVAYWMKRPGVRERIEEMKAESSARCSLSREAYIRSLVEMYQAQPGDASMDNPRCDVLITRGQKACGVPAEAGGRGAALQAGWLGPSHPGAGGGGNGASRFSWWAVRARGNAGWQQSKRRGGWQQCRTQQGNKQSRKRRQALTRSRRWRRSATPSGGLRGSTRSAPATGR